MALTDIKLISRDSNKFAILGSKTEGSGSSLYPPVTLGNDKSFLTSTVGIVGADASNSFVDGLTEAAVNTELADINTNFQTIAGFLGLAIP